MDMQRIRRDFPCFAVEGFPVYLDNGATTQKPACVLEALNRYYTAGCSNIHRGNYRLSRSADRAYADARECVSGFLNGGHGHVIFTKGTTEAINLAVSSFCAPRLGPGKNVVVTAAEHHSNFLPWRAACLAAGAEFRVAPINRNGQLVLEEYERLLDRQTVMTAFAAVANSTGVRLPVEEMIEAAHRKGVPVLIDGAQSVAHGRCDLPDCEFFCFSGHKVYGPTGIGVLWGKREVLEGMSPCQYGGGMISGMDREFSQAVWQDLPDRLEAGTPPIAGALGLAAALDYVKELGPEKILAHEQELTRMTAEEIRKIPGLNVVGCSESSIVAVTLERASPFDLGVYLDLQNIAVRCGSHCSLPAMYVLGTDGTVRISYGLYNTREEAETLCRALREFAKRYG